MAKKAKKVLKIDPEFPISPKEEAQTIDIMVAKCPACGSLISRLVYTERLDGVRRLTRRCARCLKEYKVIERRICS